MGQVEIVDGEDDDVQMMGRETKYGAQGCDLGINWFEERKNGSSRSTRVLV